jgi:hypothetical protein
VAAHRWRSEVFDKVLAMVPGELSDRLAPAEVFHEILEHRWFLSEQAGTDARHHGRGAVLCRGHPADDGQQTALRSHSAVCGRADSRSGRNTLSDLG